MVEGDRAKEGDGAGTDETDEGGLENVRSLKAG